MSPLRSLLDSKHRALLMGILNRTPDSFSDGGRFVGDAEALAHAERLAAEGADILDIGAESTRPGSQRISAAEQIARLGDIVSRAAKRLLVSIDTTSVQVAERALADGASIVNSVSLEAAAELGALAARRGASLVLMHSRGSMAEMRGYSDYDDAAYGDVVADVARELGAAAARAAAAGLAPADIVLDPGLGFAKNARQSLELCARLGELCALGHPVLVGPSRKSFLAFADVEAKEPKPTPERRLGGTIAATLECVRRGAAIVRVHDIEPVRQALAVAEGIAAVPIGARAALSCGSEPTCARSGGL